LYCLAKKLYLRIIIHFLIAEQTMPVLHWIGKDKVINHHLDVPYKPLIRQYNYNSEAESENKIIQGDNLEALKSLLPQYEGKIKCIYIDPPYNTGNEGWVYNDNVNDPKIKKWLGQVVGKESEDLTRHDKWLCMMYPRLKLLHKLLAEDGAIFISIDDNEQANLKLMMDEIFGGAMFKAIFIWKSRQIVDSRNQTMVSSDHEYILLYSKSTNFKLRGKISDKSKYSNSDNDPRGPWMSNSILGLANAEQRPNLHYSIFDPETGIEYHCPPDTGWRYSKETMHQKIVEKRIVFPAKLDGRPREKKFLRELSSEYTGFSTILSSEVGFTLNGTRTIREIVPESKFAFPKPYELVETLIEQISDSNSIILDSFAGSGTTGQAVLSINKKDGGNRKFILIEMEDYSENITAERVKRVITGYSFGGTEKSELYKIKINKSALQKANKILLVIEELKKQEEKNYDDFELTTEDDYIVLYGFKKNRGFVEGTGGSFSYYRLGATLFDEDGFLNESLGIAAIRKYVYFTETQQLIDEAAAALHPAFMGSNQDTDYYFHYEANEATVLNYNFLQTITQKAEQYIIYADNCLLTNDVLSRYHIIFKKIPRDIRRF
jgi:adenine-specific DNA-methyltransferase